jgi:succinate dehydrogenase / fumarate reductase flavoprotein subunit
VADFIELGQLMARDALERNESCGGHFREEYQDAEGETLRDDENYKYVAAWEYKGMNAKDSNLHKEALNYEFIKIAARNYK